MKNALIQILAWCWCFVLVALMLAVRYERAHPQRKERE
jgi:hypothetical protein